MAYTGALEAVYGGGNGTPGTVGPALNGILLSLDDASRQARNPPGNEAQIGLSVSGHRSNHQRSGIQTRLLRVEMKKGLVAVRGRVFRRQGIDDEKIVGLHEDHIASVRNPHGTAGAISRMVESADKIQVGGGEPKRVVAARGGSIPGFRPNIGLPPSAAVLSHPIDHHRVMPRGSGDIPPPGTSIVGVISRIEKQFPAIGVQHEVKFVFVLVTIPEGTGIEKRVHGIGSPRTAHDVMPRVREGDGQGFRRGALGAQGGPEEEIPPFGKETGGLEQGPLHIRVTRIVQTGNASIGHHGKELIAVHFLQPGEKIRGNFLSQAIHVGSFEQGGEVGDHPIVVARRQFDLHAVGIDILVQLPIQAFDGGSTPGRRLAKLGEQHPGREQSHGFFGEPIAAGGPALQMPGLIGHALDDGDDGLVGEARRAETAVQGVGPDTLQANAGGKGLKTAIRHGRAIAVAQQGRRVAPNPIQPLLQHTGGIALVPGIPVGLGQIAEVKMSVQRFVPQVRSRRSGGWIGVPVDGSVELGGPGFAAAAKTIAESFGERIFGPLRAFRRIGVQDHDQAGAGGFVTVDPEFESRRLRPIVRDVAKRQPGSLRHVGPAAGSRALADRFRDPFQAAVFAAVLGFEIRDRRGRSVGKAQLDVVKHQGGMRIRSQAPALGIQGDVSNPIPADGILAGPSLALHEGPAAKILLAQRKMLPALPIHRQKPRIIVPTVGIVVRLGGRHLHIAIRVIAPIDTPTGRFALADIAGIQGLGSGPVARRDGGGNSLETGMGQIQGREKGLIVHHGTKTTPGVEHDILHQENRLRIGGITPAGRIETDPVDMIPAQRLARGPQFAQGQDEFSPTFPIDGKGIGVVIDAVGGRILRGNDQRDAGAGRGGTVQLQFEDPDATPVGRREKTLGQNRTLGVGPTGDASMAVRRRNAAAAGPPLAGDGLGQCQWRNANVVHPAGHHGGAERVQPDGSLGGLGRNPVSRGGFAPGADLHRRTGNLLFPDRHHFFAILVPEAQVDSQSFGGAGLAHFPQLDLDHAPPGHGKAVGKGIGAVGGRVVHQPQADVSLGGLLPADKGFFAVDPPIQRMPPRVKPFETAIA